MKNIVGIDPSYSATGIAYGDGTTGIVKWQGRERCRLLDAHDQITSGLLWRTEQRSFTPDLVVIEGYSHGSKHSTHKMGELGGVIRLALMHASIDYLDVPPTVVKKYATGKGNANKEAVLAEAIRRLNYQGSSPDEADALWLRQIGLAIQDHPDAVEVPATHAAALEKLA